MHRILTIPTRKFTSLLRFKFHCLNLDVPKHVRMIVALSSTGAKMVRAFSPPNPRVCAVMSAALLGEPGWAFLRYVSKVFRPQPFPAGIGNATHHQPFFLDNELDQGNRNVSTNVDAGFSALWVASPESCSTVSIPTTPGFDGAAAPAHWSRRQCFQPGAKGRQSSRGCE